MKRGFNQIMIMPTGLFGLASVLEQRGFDVRILHLGLSTTRFGDFDFAAYLLHHRPRLVGLSLHWFYSTAAVLRLARRVKQIHPKTRVVVGGFTASYFAGALGADPAVDFVIRGDGELALVKLLGHLMQNKDVAPNAPLTEVPNLVYRDAQGVVQQNDLICLTPTSGIRPGSLFRPDLLAEAKRYFASISLYKDFDDRIVSNRRDLYSNVLCYTPGRGCPFDCVFCGGNRTAQRKLFRRKKPIFFELSMVLNDLQRAARFGIRTLRLSFDPDPQRKFYKTLFSKLAAQNITFRLVFDCWTLPDRGFIDSVKRCFRPDSLLVLSPDAANPQIRRLNKPHPAHAFTNRALRSSLALMRDRNVAGHVFFGAGLPFETAAHLAQTQALALDIRRMGFNVSVLPLDCDPGSTVFADPQLFAVRLPARSLADFARLTATDRRRFGWISKTLSPQQIEGFIDDTVARLNAVASC